MKFTLEGIGKISTATVLLDGITVVAGPNGSGKSTVGRALMTWCSVLRQLTQRLVIERFKSAREAINAVLALHDLPDVGSTFSLSEVGIVDIFRVDEWMLLPDLQERLEGRTAYIFGERNSQHDAEKIYEFKDEIAKALEEVASRNSSYYLPTIFADAFVTAFGKAFAHNRQDSNDSLVNVVFASEVCSEVRFSGDDVSDWTIVPSEKVPLVFYFEPVHLLDLYASRMTQRSPSLLRLSATARYKAPDVDWKLFLDGELDKSEWSVERKKKHAAIEAELDALLDVIRGRLEKKDRELRFWDKDVSLPIPVMNVASGIKTMGVIEKGIREGVIQPGCFLIIDEPESNLHPQWQVEFAHFLVKLNARFGMRLLLNTHSPFFLKAIEVFSREEGVASSSHYYHMVKDDCSYTYRTKEMTDGTNEIFKTYFDAMNDLMSR